MANLSLRGVDGETARRLKAEARQQGISINRLVIQLIRQGVGLQRAERRRAVYHDLDALAGAWSKGQAAAFLKALSDFEDVDRSLWQ